MSFEEAFSNRDVPAFLQLLKRGKRPDYFLLNNICRNMNDPDVRQMLKDSVRYRVTIDNFQYNLFIGDRPEDIMLESRAQHWTHAFEDEDFLCPMMRSYLRRHLTNTDEPVELGLKKEDIVIAYELELAAAIDDQNRKVIFDPKDNVHTTLYQINGENYGFSSDMLALVASIKKCPLTGEKLPDETLAAVKNKFRTLESLGVVHQLPIVIQPKVDKADHRETECAIKRFEELVTMEGDRISYYRDMHSHQMQTVIDEKRGTAGKVSLDGLTREHCYATMVRILLIDREKFYNC